MRVPGKVAALMAAAAAACVAVSACGSVQMGAAALTGSNRISSATLTAQVSNLKAAYRSDQAKGVAPQRSTGQEAQQVLTWLITFNVYDKVAGQNKINVTPEQQAQVNSELSAAAQQSKVTVPEYLSAGAALPPDLLPQLTRYVAILRTLESRITGGKTAATSAEQSHVQTVVAHDQCLASKSLGITVNPQYGEFDYTSYSVVPKPSTLAANPNAKPSLSTVVLKPPC
jgi:hypothetical protein